MAVFGYAFAVWVAGVVGGIVFVFFAQRCGGIFGAPEDVLLFLQRGSVPKFYHLANDAYGLVGAVFCPCGFVLAVFGDACPQHSIGDFGVADIGVACAVAEAK